MKKLLLIALVTIVGLGLLYVQAPAEQTKTRVILLIAEQNIEGPQRAWWASEVDLSTTEAKVATRLIEAGYEVLEPSVLNRIVRRDRAFRILNLSEGQSLKLGHLSKAHYIVLGKALASGGGTVPQSTMRSCFANITAKLIRVKDGKVVAYLDAEGRSVHMDMITGGREALANAGSDLALKLINALAQQGGR